ncbi:MAG TPA: isoprenyl transferase [Ruminococcaceae bacterium]|nr:isoprenyl transferase [Oscillospiraceae bacterium]HBG55591.1 isoprenyl transferase [Oscillospiraceae bacterium]HBQ47041.1 isoprenyl transferase [Oscillospiraceae bacterium]HBT91554.1 isoprenyl transferase [Oscillospiraceae bacterium]HCB91235.1 isoprenyl transferase [Oscillospiraceae bacterium]
MTNRVLPRHLGIIMDGNGRWAKKRGLPRSAGHAAGAAVFKTIVRYCSRIGIQYLTVYAFSTENWKRPHDEILALMNLFRQYMTDALTSLLDRDIRIRFLGDTSVFDPRLQDLIAQVKRRSEDRTGMVLNIALNYGGRAELARACRLLAQDVREGRLDPGQIDEQAISARLYTAGEPDPDLIIRPSGEKRISNFLLWQSAYAEYVVMDILWPDFRPKDLERALDEYSARHRRFGGI